MPKVTSVTTISGPSTLIEGFGKAQFALSNGTSMTISEALYSLRSSRTFMSFKDIRANESYVETAHTNDVDFFYMTSKTYGEKRILEKLRCLSSDFYITTIHLTKHNFIIRLTPIDKSSYMLWHDRLGHPGHNTMLRTMNASYGYPFRGKNFVIKSEKLMPSLLY